MKNSYLKPLSLLIVASALLLPTACKKKDDEASCAKDVPGSIDCVKSGDPTFVSLPIEFDDSYFMDSVNSEWKSLQKAQLDGGSITTTLPIYSTFLSTPKTEAINKASQAKAQFENGISGQVNDIPYIELKDSPDTSYVWRYQKSRLDGSVEYQTSGQVPKVAGKHILPIVNETFNNQLYTSAAKAGVEYNHTLSFSAQKGSVVSNNIKTIRFRTIYIVPNVDFKSIPSAEISGLTLANRWSYFFNGVDQTPVQSMKFAKLEANERGGEASPLDVKITFKEVPKAEVIQTLFYEIPFNLSVYRDTKASTGFPEVSPVRGYQFEERVVNLDTKTPIDSTPNPALGLKIYLAGTEVFQAKNTSGQYLYRETNEGTSIRLPSVPAHTPFDIEFALDFSVSPNILSPLKPDCFNEKGLSFNPIQTDIDRNAASNVGDYLSVCHPDTLKTETIPVGSTAIPRKDTWFGYFNFAPFVADTVKGPSVYRLGFLNGVKEIEIKISGCVKVQMKPTSSTTWETKTTGTGGCGDAYQDYSYFSFTKRYSIFDGNHQDADGLKTLINIYRGKPTVNASELYMNKKKVEPTSKFLF